MDVRVHIKGHSRSTHTQYHQSLEPFPFERFCMISGTLPRKVRTINSSNSPKHLDILSISASSQFATLHTYLMPLKLQNNNQECDLVCIMFKRQFYFFRKL